MATAFSTSEAVSFAWQTVKQNLGFFLLLLLILFGISFMSSFVTKALEDGPVFLTIIFQLISTAISLMIGLGMMKITLAFVDGEKPEFNELFSTLPYIVKYFLASILYGLIVTVGLVLLIVPGIMWAIKYAYMPFVIIDKNLGPIEALKESAKITKGSRWQILLFGLTMIGVEILGLLALVVGLLVAVPVVMVASAYVYRQLASRSIINKNQIAE
ncbi:DUF975 family protein [Candidatus Beckwithbacteria bacterium]|nr:DUF975 family protein [Candidatus Beckwithbacteria bacterium]